MCIEDLNINHGLQHMPCEVMTRYSLCWSQLQGCVTHQKAMNPIGHVTGFSYLNYMLMHRFSCYRQKWPALKILRYSVQLTPLSRQKTWFVLITWKLSDRIPSVRGLRYYTEYALAVTQHSTIFFQHLSRGLWLGLGRPCDFGVPRAA